MFIHTQNPLSVGSELMFQLVVPQLDAPIELSGVVQWVALAGKDKEPGMGIRFVYESDDTKASTHQRIETLMRRKLGRVVYRKMIKKQD